MVANAPDSVACHRPWVTARARLVRLVSALAVAGLLGCGGNSAGGPDGGDPFDSRSTGTDLSPSARPLACAGTVQVTGTLPQGTPPTAQPFTASYVHAGYTGGDCAETLSLTLADGTTTDGTSVVIALGHVPGTSTFVGATTPAVTVQSGTSSWEVGGDVEVTAYTMPNGSDPTTVGLAGTVRVKANGADVTGTFATPFCQTAFCI